jgi:small subunit ribosomal protein S4
MARYTGPKCKLCRREGEKLFLKGERCYSSKCPIERKKGANPPGQHGYKYKHRRQSDYGRHLREKQKVKRMYWVKESQFKKYYENALEAKGNTGENMLQQLERRLDNVLFKGGLVVSRSVARQLINHGKCLVNDHKVDIPSYQVEEDDVITLKNDALEMEEVKETLAAEEPAPEWMKRKGAVLKVERFPKKEEIKENIDIQMIVEFYSR